MENIEYWEGVIEQHQNHLGIMENLGISDIADRLNSQKAIEEASLKIIELE
jgi:hypothetical protein